MSSARMLIQAARAVAADLLVVSAAGLALVKGREPNPEPRIPDQ